MLICTWSSPLAYQAVEQRVVEKRPLRDQIRVETGGGRRLDERNEIASAASARRPRNALERRRDRRPVARRGSTASVVELVAIRSQVERVIAVRALQIAAIRQLAQQRQRPRRAHRTKPRASQPLEELDDILARVRRRLRRTLGDRVTICGERRVPSTSSSAAAAGALRTSAPSGTSSITLPFRRDAASRPCRSLGATSGFI